MQYDFITGNFGEKSGGLTLQAVFGAAGFFNPDVQILAQTYGKFTDPDPAKRREIAVKMGILTAIGGVRASMISGGVSQSSVRPL